MPTDNVITATNDLKAAVMRKILAAVPVGMGIGALGRGLFGLPAFLRRQWALPTVPKANTEITVLTNKKDKQEKYADDTSLAARLLKYTGLATPKTGPRGGLTGLFAGDEGQNASGLLANDFPWMTVGMPLALGGGIYGGYKLTDWLLNKNRKRELDSELDIARNNYEKALRNLAKTADADATPAPMSSLDMLTTEMEKRGGIMSQALASYLLMNLLAAGLGGFATYQWAKSRQPTKALQQAHNKRQRQLFETRLLPVQAKPVVAEPAAVSLVPNDNDESLAA